MFKYVMPAAVMVAIAVSFVAAPEMHARTRKPNIFVLEIAEPRPDGAKVSVATLRSDPSGQEVANQISKRLPNDLSSYTVAQIMQATEDASGGPAQAKKLECKISFRPLHIECYEVEAKALIDVRNQRN